MSTARKIVAIGGGELRDMETLEIDKRIIDVNGQNTTEGTLYSNCEW